MFAADGQDDLRPWESEPDDGQAGTAAGCSGGVCRSHSGTESGRGLLHYTTLCSPRVL